MSPETRSTRLIDHLVSLSTLRGRDALLRKVTQALADTLDVRMVQTYSLVRDEDRRFWLPLTQAIQGSEVRFVSDPMRADIDLLSLVGTDPERLRCLDHAETVVSTVNGEVVTRFPLKPATGESPWGVAEFHSAAPFDAQDITTVTQLLDMYSNLINLLDYSECDALTGLWNRKPFEDLFYKAMPQAEVPPSLPPEMEHRVVKPTAAFWLAMLDIDHFKKVNDTYGHLIGDEVLILVGRILKSSFRTTDTVYRFGGEEFVVVMRCNDDAAAVAAAERFRVAMEAFNFPQVGRITASIGLTRIISGDSPNAACERADQAVYYAKHHGRNQVCSEADLVQRGLLQSKTNVGDIELF
jgi:diguanylate cyclase (GGDEF)-like protein